MDPLQEVRSAITRSAITVQSYAPRDRIVGVQVDDLPRFVDDGGEFMELGRLLTDRPEIYRPPVGRVAQINYSRVEAGAIKAFHLHERQRDVWFVPPSDRALVILHDLRIPGGTTMRLVLGAGRAQLLTIPPGVAHGIRCLDARGASLIYLVDQHFDPTPETCDEKRLPWDFLGPEIWNITNG